MREKWEGRGGEKGGRVEGKKGGKGGERKKGPPGRDERYCEH